MASPASDTSLRPARRRGLADAARARAAAAWDFSAAVVRCAAEHDVPGRASQFAYHAFLATVPFLIVVVSLFGLLADPTVYNRIVSAYGDVIPQDMQGLLQRFIRLATEGTQRATFFLVLGALGALWVTGSVFGTLIGSLDRAYQVPSRPFVRNRLVSLALAAAGVVLVPLATLLLVAGLPAIDALAERLSSHEAVWSVARWLVYPLGMAALALLLVTLYRVGPNGHSPRVREVVPGALVAVAGWLLTTWLFRLYVQHFGAYNEIYGTLAAVVVYLLFLSLSGLAILIGTEINGELSRRRRELTRRTASAPGRGLPKLAP